MYFGTSRIIKLLSINYRHDPLMTLSVPIDGEAEISNILFREVIFLSLSKNHSIKEV